MVIQCMKILKEYILLIMVIILKLKGVEVTPPRLAYIIGGILKNEEESIYDLMHYRANPELIPITQKIAKADKEIDKISNLILIIRLVH